MTAVITATQLEAAARAVTDARTRVDQLRSRGMLTRAEVDGTLTRALGVEQELIDRQQAQQARLAERAEVEREHATELKRLARDLGKAHDTAAAAVAAGHLTGIVDALAARNAAVVAVHSRLTELGLPATDDVVEYETGACAGLSATSVMIAGHAWSTVPVDVVAMRLVGRALTPHLGVANQAVAWARSYRGGTMATAAADALIDDLAVEPAA
jgi:hypothetical protein